MACEEITQSTQEVTKLTCCQLQYISYSIFFIFTKQLEDSQRAKAEKNVWKVKEDVHIVEKASQV